MLLRARDLKVPGARLLALKILLAAHSGDRRVEDLLAGALRRHELPRPERALLLELVQGVKRRELTLDHHLAPLSRLPLNKLEAPVLLILRLGAYQLLYLDRVPPWAAVDEAGKLAKAWRLPHRTGGFINAVLRRLAKGERAPLPDAAKNPAAALSLETSHPAWLAKRWLKRWGPEEARRRLDANNLVPPLTIRVNTLKIDPPVLAARLSREGVEAVPCVHAATGLTLVNLETSPASLPTHRQGLWLFQDEAAQLVTPLLGLTPGARVLEIGAGRGGKTTHLAELLQDRGMVLAVDEHRRRLRELVENVRRWGAASICPLRADATRPLPVRPGSLDGVLIDAPCSGLGVIRRHPEIKTRLKRPDLDVFPPRQRAMLAAAAPLLKPGGRLLYVTCTTEPAENEEVVTAFLQAHPQFRLAPLPAPYHQFATPTGFFQTSPADHHLDGFFAALLQKE